MNYVDIVSRPVPLPYHVRREIDRRLDTLMIAVQDTFEVGGMRGAVVHNFDEIQIRNLSVDDFVSMVNDLSLRYIYREPAFVLMEHRPEGVHRTISLSQTTRMYRIVDRYSGVSRSRSEPAIQEYSVLTEVSQELLTEASRTSEHALLSMVEDVNERSRRNIRIANPALRPALGEGPTNVQSIDRMLGLTDYRLFIPLSEISPSHIPLQYPREKKEKVPPQPIANARKIKRSLMGIPVSDMKSANGSVRRSPTNSKGESTLKLVSKRGLYVRRQK